MKKNNNLFLESGLGIHGKVFNKETVKNEVIYDPSLIAKKINEHIDLGARSMNKDSKDISAKYLMYIFSNKKNTFLNIDENGIPFSIYTTDAEVIQNVVSLRLVGLYSSNGEEIKFLPSMNEPIICDNRSLNEILYDLYVDFDNFTDVVTSGDEYSITVNSRNNKLVRRRK